MTRTPLPDLRGAGAVHLDENVMCRLLVVAKVAFESDRRCAFGFRIGDLRDQQSPSHVQAHEKRVARGPESSNVFVIVAHSAT